MAFQTAVKSSQKQGGCFGSQKPGELFFFLHNNRKKDLCIIKLKRLNVIGLLKACGNG